MSAVNKDFDIGLFRPHYLLLNPHIQSIYSGIFVKGGPFEYVRERFDTPDGDFFDVDVVDYDFGFVIAFLIFITWY